MSECACIRGVYDFDLLSDQCNDIIYIDRSEFQKGPQYATAPTYTLDITYPDGTVHSHEVTKGIPLHLDLGECFPVGVFLFSVTSCTERFYKRAAITCSLWCGYVKAVAKIGIGVDKETVRSIREDLEKVERIVTTDFVTADSLISSITRRLARVNCECSC